MENPTSELFLPAFSLEYLQNPRREASSKGSQFGEGRRRFTEGLSRTLEGGKGKNGEGTSLERRKKNNKKREGYRIN